MFWKPPGSALPVLSMAAIFEYSPVAGPFCRAGQGSGCEDAACNSQAEMRAHAASYEGTIGASWNRSCSASNEGCCQVCPFASLLCMAGTTLYITIELLGGYALVGMRKTPIHGCLHSPIRAHGSMRS